MEENRPHWTFSPAIIGGSIVSIATWLVLWGRFDTWFTMLIGGLAGSATAFLGYNPRVVLQGVRAAVQAFVNNLRNIRKEQIYRFFEFIFQKVDKAIRTVVYNVAVVGNALLTPALHIAAFVWLSGVWPKTSDVMMLIMVLFGLAAFIDGLLTFMGLGMIFTVLASFSDENNQETAYSFFAWVLGEKLPAKRKEAADKIIDDYYALQMRNGKVWLVLFLINLASILVTVIFLACGVVYSFWYLMTVLGTPVRTFFRFTHSSHRNIVWIDAPLGALFGWCIAALAYGSAEAFRASLLTQISVLVLGALIGYGFGRLSLKIMAMQAPHAETPTA